MSLNFSSMSQRRRTVLKGFLTVTASTVPAMLWPRHRGAIRHKDKQNVAIWLRRKRLEPKIVQFQVKSYRWIENIIDKFIQG